MNMKLLEQSFTTNFEMSLLFFTLSTLCYNLTAEIRTTIAFIFLMTRIKNKKMIFFVFQ